MGTARPRPAGKAARRDQTALIEQALSLGGPEIAAALAEHAAASAGLTPEFGCRMGICFTCTRVKESGCTRNLRTGELNSDPDVQIQLCISAPVGDVAVNL